MRARVTESVNYIEQEMKKRVETFKDAHNADEQFTGSGSASQSMPGTRQGKGSMSLQDKYSHLL